MNKIWKTLFRLSTRKLTIYYNIEGRNKIHPTYKTEKIEENNNYQCKIFKGDEYIETGYGNSKKKSEQDDYKNALMKFCVLSE